MKILAPLLLLVAFGCGPAADDDVTGPAPTVDNVAFEGKTDPAMAATWETVDKKSTLVLGKDGAATLKSNVATPGGQQNSEVKGEWKMNDGALLIKKKDGGEVVRYYATVKDKDTIEVRRVKDSKIMSLYKRK